MRERLGDAWSLVDLVYAAALDPEAWPQALAAITDAVGGLGTYLYTVDRDTRVTFSTHDGLPGTLVEEYVSEFAQLCPRLRYVTEHPQEMLVYDYKYTDERGIDQSAYYDWLARSGGARYAIGARVYQDTGDQVCLAVQRSRAHGHVQREEIELFARLAPHVERAVRIAHGLQVAQERLTALEALVERSSSAVVLVDSVARVTYCNATASRLLGEGDGLASCGSRLVATAREDAARLDRALSAVALSTAGGPITWEDPVQVRRTSGRRPYLLRLLPLPRAHSYTTDRQAAAAVFIIDPDAPAGSARCLMSAYRLTPTEALIALGLANGATLESVARELGMALSTARLHIEHIYRKTGVHKQHDLVRAVLLVAREMPL